MVLGEGCFEKYVWDTRIKLFCEYLFVFNVICLSSSLGGVSLNLKVSL